MTPAEHDITIAVCRQPICGYASAASASRCVGPWAGFQAGRNGRLSLLSPVFAFLLAVLVVVIKEAGLAGSLAALGTGAVTYLGFGGFAVPM